MPLATGKTTTINLPTTAAVEHTAAPGVGKFVGMKYGQFSNLDVGDGGTVQLLSGTDIIWGPMTIRPGETLPPIALPPDLLPCAENKALNAQAPTCPAGGINFSAYTLVQPIPSP